MPDRQIVCFCSCVRAYARSACLVEWISKNLAPIFPFPFLARRTFPFPFWGRRAFLFPFTSTAQTSYATLVGLIGTTGCEPRPPIPLCLTHPLPLRVLIIESYCFVMEVCKGRRQSMRVDWTNFEIFDQRDAEVKRRSINT